MHLGRFKVLSITTFCKNDIKMNEDMTRDRRKRHLTVASQIITQKQLATNITATNLTFENVTNQ